VLIDGLDAWDRPPEEPAPTGWRFPSPSVAGDNDLVAVGGDLEPGTILRAYRQGLFPMNVSRRQLGWWSPAQRGVIPLDGLHVSRSLRRSCRRYRLSVDRAFRVVMSACANPKRPHGWITPAFIDAYSRLHELGWAHSVEAWTDDGELAGGLYGLRIGGLFAGESMMHRERDASKVALVGLVGLLRVSQATLLDVQWLTPHLRSLGAVPVTREDYLRQLAGAVRMPSVAARQPMG
jgi:leucyl/phenylalanyl-tRNA--protein transferase